MAKIFKDQQNKREWKNKPKDWWSDKSAPKATTTNKTRAGVGFGVGAIWGRGITDNIDEYTWLVEARKLVVNQKGGIWEANGEGNVNMEDAVKWSNEKKEQLKKQELRILQIEKEKYVQLQKQYTSGWMDIDGVSATEAGLNQLKAAAGKATEQFEQLKKQGGRFGISLSTQPDSYGWWVEDGVPIVPEPSLLTSWVEKVPFDLLRVIWNTACSAISSRYYDRLESLRVQLAAKTREAELAVGRTMAPPPRNVSVNTDGVVMLETNFVPAGVVVNGINYYSPNMWLGVYGVIQPVVEVQETVKRRKFREEPNCEIEDASDCKGLS